MTDKELHRLRRSELLEIMIAQKRAQAAMERRLQEAEEELRSLREKLDKRDETIRELNGKLLSALDRRGAGERELRSVEESAVRLDRAVSQIERTAAICSKAMQILAERKQEQRDPR